MRILLLLILLASVQEQGCPPLYDPEPTKEKFE